MPRPGEVLLDTSLIVDLLAGDHTVAEKLEGTRPAVSAITAGELEVGLRLISRALKVRQRTQAFLARCTLLPVEPATGEAYATIKLMLRRKGQPIPENDVWIAAVALQHDLLLVTRDRTHFEPEHFRDIQRLHIELW